MHYSSWFDIHLLKAIVNQFGSEKDQAEMQIYTAQLILYLQQSLFELPSKQFSPGLVQLFVILPEDQIPSGKGVKNITRNLSQLLGITDGILQLIGFQ